MDSLELMSSQTFQFISFSCVASKILVDGFRHHVPLLLVIIRLKGILLWTCLLGESPKNGISHLPPLALQHYRYMPVTISRQELWSKYLPQFSASYPFFLCFYAPFTWKPMLEATQEKSGSLTLIRIDMLSLRPANSPRIYLTRWCKAAVLGSAAVSSCCIVLLYGIVCNRRRTKQK